MAFSNRALAVAAIPSLSRRAPVTRTCGSDPDSPRASPCALQSRGALRGPEWAYVYSSGRSAVREFWVTEHSAGRTPPCALHVS